MKVGVRGHCTQGGDSECGHEAHKCDHPPEPDDFKQPVAGLLVGVGRRTPGRGAGDFGLFLGPTVSIPPDPKGHEGAEAPHPAPPGDIHRHRSGGVNERADHGRNRGQQEGEEAPESAIAGALELVFPAIGYPADRGDKELGKFAKLLEVFQDVHFLDSFFIVFL